jgi:hypothetical protein
VTAEELQGELRRHLRCGICQKNVDRVSRFAQPGCGSTAFEVACHGETEVVEVPYAVMEDPTLRIDLVPAFSRLRLGPGGSRDFSAGTGD